MKTKFEYTPDIHNIVYELINGRCITPCPFDEAISQEMTMVGSIACASCECHLGLYTNEKRDLVCMCDRNMAE